ncbi:MAG: transposase [Dechloromonas sp.]|nr:MAG: transposase [Dechloromonas sp.]
MDAFEEVMPDENAILRFRHLLEKPDQEEAIFAEVNAVLSEKLLPKKRARVVDATLIAAPCSMKNEDEKRNPERGLVHTVECTTAKVADIAMLESCLHGEETLVLGGRGYHRKNRTIDTFEKEGRLMVLKPTKKPAGGTLSKEQKAFNRLSSVIRAVVEHPFPGGQAAIRLCQGSLSRPRQEYRADRDAVRPDQPLAGTQTIVAFDGRGAPVKREVQGETTKFHARQSRIVCFLSCI